MKKKLQTPDFLITPYEIIADRHISPAGERIYSVVYWFKKMKNERCTAGNSVIADIAVTTPQVVANELTKLEERGYIKRTFKDQARRCRDEIIPLVVFKKVSPTDEFLSSGDETLSPTDETEVSPTGEQNKNIYNKNIYIWKSLHPTCIKAFEIVDERAKDWYGNTTQKKALDEILNKPSIQGDAEKLKKIIGILPLTNKEQYAPKVHSFVELLNKWDKLKDHYATKHVAKMKIQDNIVKTF